MRTSPFNRKRPKVSSSPEKRFCCSCWVRALLVSVVRTSAYSELSLSTESFGADDSATAFAFCWASAAACCACCSCVCVCWNCWLVTCSCWLVCCSCCDSAWICCCCTATASFKACTSALTGLGLLTFFLGVAVCACSTDANSRTTLSLITAFISSPFARICGSGQPSPLRAVLVSTSDCFVDFQSLAAPCDVEL